MIFTLQIAGGVALGLIIAMGFAWAIAKLFGAG